MTYPKIETLFNRDEKFNVKTDELKMPVINTIKSWHITEKIDGTNIRVMLSETGEVSFGGRTERANIPADLIQYLMKTFTSEKMKSLWKPNKEGKIEPYKITLFGEGYGAGIQKAGRNYREDKSFRLFDVLVDDKWWLDWENTVDIANQLEIKTVPYLGEWSLQEIVEKVKQGIVSEVAKEETLKENITMSEGIVGRTIEPLFDKRSKRLIIKLKTADFKN